MPTLAPSLCRQAISAIPQVGMGKTVDGRSYKRHYGYSSSAGPESTSPPRALRLSLARAILREIRNLVWRIAEIRRRELDLQGISIDLPPEIAFPREQQESGLAHCMQGTHNLCTSRHAVSPIEVELFLQGRRCGAS